MDIDLQPMTVAAFLTWEEGQEDRYEFDGNQPIPTNGGTLARGTLIGNLYALLQVALRGSVWQASVVSLKVRIGSRVRYPDVTVSARGLAPTTRLDPAPALLVEVLSASTEVTDRTLKLAEYTSLPSLRRYVMVDQTALVVTSHLRVDGTLPAGWREETRRGAAALLDMPEIGARLRLADIYEGVDLDAPLPL